MTGIQWTGDNADEMFHYAGKERAVVLVRADGDTMRNNYDETTSIVPVLHVGDWLYREAGGVFAVPNDSRWALDSLTRRADADVRFRDMRNAEPAVHPFYTHGRYGYGDKVTWQGKPALIVGHGEGVYSLNVVYPQMSDSNYVTSYLPPRGVGADELAPGWPA